MLFTCRGKWNNDDVLQNECFVGFKFSKIDLDKLIYLYVICDLVSNQWGKYMHFFFKDILQQIGGKKHKRSNVSNISLGCFGILFVCLFFFLCKVSTGSLFYLWDIKCFWKNQKTNRSLSNVISFFSLMWTASLKY